MRHALSYLILVVGTVGIFLYRGAVGHPVRGASSTPIPRHLYLKLPLEQPRFHWRFESSAEFLSGKLTLRIIRDDSATEFVIFDEGVISEGWQTINENRGGTIYFGFRSSDTYPTAPGDSLELELEVPQDLDGEGPIQTGYLPSGTYASSGSYSGLTTRPWAKKEEYFPWAFMQCWRAKWPLVITAEEGWLDPEAAARSRESLSRIADRRDLGTDGESCLEPGSAR